MLLHLQKWEHAYRDSRYYGAVDTNNGVEALNKVLKYGYLPKKNSLTLSGIATLLVKNYLPGMYQKYIFQNYKLSGGVVLKAGTERNQLGSAPSRKIV